MAESKPPTPTQSTSTTKDDRADIRTFPIEELVRQVEELKDRGNEHFRIAEWNDALSAYGIALERLPKRKEIEKIVAAEPLDDEDDQDETQERTASAGHASTLDQDASEEHPFASDPRCVKLRAVLNANVGACHVKLGCYKEAIDACSQAILDDPQYVKALQRRASANEQINTWSSLTSAQEDYNSLLKLLPEGSSQHRDAQRRLRALVPRVEAAQKAETAEMLGKLKHLGNSILGNFGLSTDNFKFEPNGQGGYSMQFTQ